MPVSREAAGNREAVGNRAIVAAWDWGSTYGAMGNIHMAWVPAR
jgi:hypothetical protein